MGATTGTPARYSVSSAWCMGWLQPRLQWRASTLYRCRSSNASMARIRMTTYRAWNQVRQVAGRWLTPSSTPSGFDMCQWLEPPVRQCSGSGLSEYCSQNTFEGSSCKNSVPYFGIALAYYGHKANLLQGFGAA